MRTWLYSLLALAMLALSLKPARADELRISPDDLRVRSAISQLLAPSLRLQLRDLAAGTPLAQEDGVVETHRLLNAAFADRKWDQDRQDLVLYYFLVARLEKSQEFSDEFARRRKLTAQGCDLMQSYLANLNKAIARAVFVTDVRVDPGPIQDFPLSSVGWKEHDGTKTLTVLHAFPEVNTRLGRQTMRGLRDLAGADLELLEKQLSDLDDAERTFLQEISLVGKELIALRAKVITLVRLPRAGLPFSF